jgi:DNA polymerase III alpha subunit
MALTSEEFMCNSNKDFVHLHAHTHFSIQDALPTPTKYALKAREMGFRATAITDHGKMGGAVEFVEACRTKTDFDPIKPIIGIEVYTCADRFDKSKTEDGRRRKLNHLTLLAQNEVGYKNLLSLSALGNDPDAFYYSPRVDWGCIEKHSEGVIALSGCLASELNQALIKEEFDTADSVVNRFKNTFNDRYFIELQYHKIEEQKHNMQHLLDFAAKYDVKTVASNDVHYLDRLDWQLHDVLIQMRDQRESRTGDKKSGKREAYGSHQFYLKSYDEMNRIFGSVPEALKNSVLISEMVEDFFKLDVPHLLPPARIPKDNEEFNRFWKTNLPHHHANEAYLAYLTFKGLKQMGLDNRTYLARLDNELKQIWYMGVTDYFLIQREMVEFMKGRSINFGIRGSGVGSLVNFCLEVCNVDPVRWNLMFERFLNPGRGTQYKIDISEFPASQFFEEYGEMDQIPYTKKLRKLANQWLSLNPDYAEHAPSIEKELWVLENQGLSSYIYGLSKLGIKTTHNDNNLWTAYIAGITEELPEGGLKVSKIAALPDVDTDIDDSLRGEVIEWTKERFGDDKVAQIGTWGRYGAKAAVVGSLKASDRFVEKHGDNAHSEALKISALISKRPGTTIEETIKESPEFSYFYRTWKDEIDNAIHLVGTISNFGVHASGVLVSSEPIYLHAPIENSKGNLCSSYDMKNVERMGLVKYDFLGLAAFQQVSICLQHIKRLHNKTVDFKNINLEDPKIFKNIYARGKTASVFQFASKGMQQALRDVNASNVEDLIAVAALYRPGPMDYIPQYAEGKRNPQSVKYSHPIIEKNMTVTYGIMVYQEQAMQMARDMAKFTWVEVDKLRKAISKKSGKDFDDACNLFKTKSLANNIDPQVVDEVLALMAKFGGYAFNRSHACSYALLSYYTAYLRCYYPSEWLAACIQVDRLDEDKLAVLLRECAQDRIVVKEPNVNESGVATSVNKKGEILLPLSTIKGVGTRAVEIIEHQPYTDIKDFCYRARPNRGMVAALAEKEALSCLTDIDQFEYYEDFMEHWDQLVAERTRDEKNAIKLNKLRDKNSLSFNDIMNNTKRTVVDEKAEDISSLLNDELFD